MSDRQQHRLEVVRFADAGIAAGAVPSFAAGLRARGADTVLVAGVAHGAHGRLHWLESEQARGWLQPGAGAGQGEVHSPSHSQALDEARLRSAFEQAMARGFVGADAAILALAATQGDGGLPRLSWGESPRFAPAPAPAADTRRPMGIYALVDSAPRLRQVLDAGVYSVQLRIKQPAGADAAWHAGLRAEMAECIALARAAGADLYINDYHALATELGAPGVHLGQEDLLAMDDAARASLLAGGTALGVSSHSVWELCRARALSPRYIACGPVWATTTKDMPWLPQGLDNLAWWCRVAQAPVVAIGGILQAWQVRDTAACGADGVCIVRGLGEQPQAVLPGLVAAFEAGRRVRQAGWPHPSLPAREAP